MRKPVTSSRRGDSAVLRRIWRLHFWVGLFAAPVLVVLACTGLPGPASATARAATPKRAKVAAGIAAVVLRALYPVFGVSLLVVIAVEVVLARRRTPDPSTPTTQAPLDDDDALAEALVDAVDGGGTPGDAPVGALQ